MRTYSIFKIPDHLGETERRARRHMLAQLGLAWLAMMQVMMFAFPGYLRSESMSAENLATLDKAIYMMNWAGFALTVPVVLDRKSTRLNSSHVAISYAVFCLKKK